MASTISLPTYEYRVGEAIGGVPVQVLRTGSLEGDATLTYGLAGDTATASRDFTGSGFTIVTMPAGTPQMTIPLPIVTNALGEPTESLVFSLVTVQGATLFAPRTARITILDDETPAPPPPAEPRSPPTTT